MTDTDSSTTDTDTGAGAGKGASTDTNTDTDMHSSVSKARVVGTILFSNGNGNSNDISDLLARLVAQKRRPLVDGILLVGVAFGFVVVGGPLAGVVSGLVLGLCWLVLPNPAAFVAGQVLLAALMAGGSRSLLWAAPAGLTLGGLLLTNTITDDPLRDGLPIVVGWVLLAAIVIGVSAVGPSWLAAGAVLAVSGMSFVALVVYGVTRLESADE